jgi:deoxyribodipyrimidine photolyase
VIIHWFRRDLRLHDNTALLDAAGLVTSRRCAEGTWAHQEGTWAQEEGT